MRSHHGLALLACLVWALLGSPAKVRADDEADASKKTCAVAFASGQRLMRSGHLLEARKMLVLCGGPQCPTIMHPDCQHWLSSVEASMPTVVFRVSSPDGAVPAQVTLAIDDQPATPLDGRAVSMDPGAHEVTLAASGFVTAHKHVVVSEGEKLHGEAVELLPLSVSEGKPEAVAVVQAPKQVAQPRRWLSTPVLIASSVAVAAGAAALTLGLKARSDDRGLDSCTPDCARETVDHVRREYLWTNVSIGIAVAGAATAAILWAVRGSSAPGTQSLALGLDVESHGLSPTLTGRF